MGQVLAFIFARAGSKGVVGKNVRLLAGKPLVAWSIECAQRVDRVARVVISTDSPEVSEIASQYPGVELVARPSELATDTSSEWLSWRHAVEHAIAAGWMTDEDIFLSVPSTCPLRSAEDLNAAIDRLAPEADLVATATEPVHNPYFTMVKLDEDGCAQRVIELNKTIWQRQMAPPVYGLTGVAFVTRPSHIFVADGVMNGRVFLSLVPPERALDIDTEFEFRIAELLMQERLKENG